MPARWMHATLAAAVLAAAAATGSDAAEPRLMRRLVMSGEFEEGLWAYGQINKGLLVHNDGEATVAYPLVDSANSSTRGGLRFQTRAADDFVFKANVEAEWNPYSTFRVNRLNDDYIDWSQWRLRKAEGIFEIDRFGTIWAGQGAMASDLSSEQDLSGTGLVAYSSVADSAGGQLFAFSGGGLSTISIGSAFSNFDGLGRLTRIRYDTPAFSGLKLKTSVGRDEINQSKDVEWDVAADYENRPENGKVWALASVAYSRVDETANRVSGSASILLRDWNVSMTAAAGGQDGGGRSPLFGYIKLGWSGDLGAPADTAFSIDAYIGDDVATKGSDSLSIGLAAVQKLPAYQTDLYATARWHDYDDSAASYDAGMSFLTGARFSF